MNEAEYLMKNYGDLGGCYLPWPTALMDNTLLDLHYCSYHYYYHHHHHHHHLCSKGQLESTFSHGTFFYIRLTIISPTDISGSFFRAELVSMFSNR